MAPVALAEAEKQGIEFATKAGNYTIKQLRGMSTYEIYELYNESKRFGFPTVIDGYFFPKSLPEIFKAHQQSQIPILVGWNSAEIPGMAFMYGKPYSEADFVGRVKETYPNNFDEVLAIYPHGSDKEVEQSATALASDRFIAYSTWKWFDLQRKNSSQAVYRYLFSKLRPPLVDQNLASGLAGGTLKKENNQPKMAELIGAPHACEIEYCMGNLGLIKEYAWTADDYKVSETMLNFFANFIKTGNPNGAGLPEWPAAAPNDPTPHVMNINVESKVVKADNDGRYLFHDRFYKN